MQLGFPEKKLLDGTEWKKNCYSTMDFSGLWEVVYEL